MVILLMSTQCYALHVSLLYLKSNCLKLVSEIYTFSEA